MPMKTQGHITGIGLRVVWVDTDAAGFVQSWSDDASAFFGDLKLSGKKLPVFFQGQGPARTQLHHAVSGIRIEAAAHVRQSDGRSVRVLYLIEPSPDKHDRGSLLRWTFCPI